MELKVIMPKERAEHHIKKLYVYIYIYYIYRHTGMIIHSPFHEITTCKPLHIYKLKGNKTHFGKD